MSTSTKRYPILNYIHGYFVNINLEDNKPKITILNNFDIPELEIRFPDKFVFVGFIHQIIDQVYDIRKIIEYLHNAEYDVMEVSRIILDIYTKIQGLKESNKHFKKAFNSVEGSEIISALETARDLLKIAMNRLKWSTDYLEYIDFSIRKNV